MNRRSSGSKGAVLGLELRIHAADVFNCSLGSFPLIYLGLPIVESVGVEAASGRGLEVLRIAPCKLHKVGSGGKGKKREK
ncbi:hypothetical protein GUJ93_ZPchr0024g29069 [Zizania palustris]|uniref:Uncharacterized protein n=1 Tax=Zizania palustris TaxID=103762 RepID=A0A8J5R3Y5_ZIZPA|nr:hypothetical protein GUJ93_ZPchr0024g29069 [Zizania palustris]